MLTQDDFKRLSDYTRNYLYNTAATSGQEWVKNFPRAAEHRWQHTLNVLRNAERIIEGEGVSPEVAEIVRAAAILHDISMFTCDHSVHGECSAQIAQEYLTEQQYPQDFVMRVRQAVAEHGVDCDLFSPAEMGVRFSWEGKVLLEADILDKLGASAIADAMLEAGKKGVLSHECCSNLAQGRAMQRAAYFKPYMWTNTAKRMTEQRFAFFEQFIEQLTDEVVEAGS